MADVVDGGGDFPVERAADVEEDEEYENHHEYAERNLGDGRCHWEQRERECVFYVYVRERDRESWISLEEEVISAYCVCDRVYEIRI